MAPVRSAHALGADEIVARAIAAQGGADKMHAIRTLRLTGTMHIGNEGFSLDAQIGIEADRRRR